MGPCEPHEIRGQVQGPAEWSEQFQAQTPAGHKMNTDSSFEEKDLGLMVDEDEKLNFICQCVLTAQKTNCIQGCTRSMARRSRKVILPLGVLLQLWGPQHNKDADSFEGVHGGTTKMIRGLEHPSYEDRQS